MHILKELKYKKNFFVTNKYLGALEEMEQFNCSGLFIMLETQISSTENMNLTLSNTILKVDYLNQAMECFGN